MLGAVSSAIEAGSLTRLCTRQWRQCQPVWEYPVNNMTSTSSGLNWPLTDRLDIASPARWRLIQVKLVNTIVRTRKPTRSKGSIMIPPSDLNFNFGVVWPWSLTYWTRSGRIHPFAPSSTCANLQQIWFIRFQNIVFTIFITNERTDGRTEGRTDRSITLCLLSVKTGEGIKRMSRFCCKLS